MDKRPARGQGGFTLIELLVVIAILAILAGAAIVGVGAMRKNARKTACQSDRDTIQTAFEAYDVSHLNDPGFTAGNATFASVAGDELLKKVNAVDWNTVSYTSGEYKVLANSGGGKYADVAAECNA